MIRWFVIFIPSVLAFSAPPIPTPIESLCQAWQNPIEGMGVFAGTDLTYFFLVPSPSERQRYHYQAFQLTLATQKLEKLFDFEDHDPVRALLPTDPSFKGLLLLSTKNRLPCQPRGPSHITVISLEKEAPPWRKEGDFSLVVYDAFPRLFSHENRGFLEIDLATRQTHITSVRIPNSELPIASMASSLWVWHMEGNTEPKGIVLYSGTRLIEGHLAIENTDQFLYESGKIAVLTRSQTTPPKLTLHTLKAWTGAKQGDGSIALGTLRPFEGLSLSLAHPFLLHYPLMEKEGKLEVLQYPSLKLMGESIPVSAQDPVQWAQTSPDGQFFVVVRKKGVSVFSLKDTKWWQVGF
jgi:hypothetical protein